MKKIKKKKVIYNIKVLSYDKYLLEEKLTSLLIEIKLKLNFFRSNILFSMPSISKKSCILRSSFVDSSSKEHLEIKKYQNIIKIEIFAKMIVKKCMVWEREKWDGVKWNCKMEQNCNNNWK